LPGVYMWPLEPLNLWERNATLGLPAGFNVLLTFAKLDPKVYMNISIPTYLGGLISAAFPQLRKKNVRPEPPEPKLVPLSRMLEVERAQLDEEGNISTWTMSRFVFARDDTVTKIWNKEHYDLFCNERDMLIKVKSNGHARFCSQVCAGFRERQRG